MRFTREQVNEMKVEAVKKALEKQTNLSKGWFCFGVLVGMVILLILAKIGPVVASLLSGSL